jgi:hypothetical protein
MSPSPSPHRLQLRRTTWPTSRYLTSSRAAVTATTALLFSCATARATRAARSRDRTMRTLGKQSVLMRLSRARRPFSCACLRPGQSSTSMCEDRRRESAQRPAVSPRSIPPSSQHEPLFCPGDGHGPIRSPASLLLLSRPHSPESSHSMSHPHKQQQRDAMPFPTPHVVRANGPRISSFNRNSPSPRLGRSMSQSLIVASEWLRDGRACTCALRGRARFTSAMRSDGARVRGQRLTELLLWTCKKD